MAGTAPNAQLARFQSKAKETLAGFTTGQKTMTVITVLAVVIGGYLFMGIAGKPTYSPLFSNLGGTDAAAITAKLTAAHIPYQLADGGATILVPAKDVFQERIDMSAAGLPNSNQQGYSLLDKEGITTSEFQQQVEYQQAVEGELDQTIEAINGVQSAVVNVVIPQDTVFSGSSGSPSASVLLELQPGVTLSSSQVQAVVHLVASSIENMTPAEVTVTDQNGDMLAAPGVSSATAGVGANDQQTESYDNELSTEIQNDLASVLGPGMAIVHVNAQLDFDQSQVNTKTYAPKGTAVSSSSTKETYGGNSTSSAVTGGVLGQTTPTTTPAGAATTPTTVPAGVPGSNYIQNSNTNNNAVSVSNRSDVTAPGSVTRMSVAVLINSSVKDSPAVIKAFVANAVGLDTKRGDSMSVGTLSFNNTQAKSAATALKAATSTKSMSSMLATVRTALILLVVALLVLYALRKLTKPVRTAIQLPLEELDLDEELELSAANMMPALSRGDPHVVASRARAAVSAADAAALGEMIDQDPAAIAEMLRGWLSEER
jgi:flagellar M-ring protein FliF